MKHATASCLLVIASLLIGCGDDVSGDGSTTSASATTGATTATTGAEASAGASTGGDVGSGGGDGGAPGVGSPASTASSGGGGGHEATPESCFAIHEESACYEAGCNMFLFKPDVVTVVDDVCHATDDLSLCFLVDEEGIGQGVPAAYVRDFDADGPRVVGLNSVEPLLGWTRCTDELAEEVPECCCDRGGVPCVGITPLPPEE